MKDIIVYRKWNLGAFGRMFLEFFIMLAVE
jgi:hypothetical protein